MDDNFATLTRRMCHHPDLGCFEVCPQSGDGGLEGFASPPSCSALRMAAAVGLHPRSGFRIGFSDVASAVIIVIIIIIIVIPQYIEAEYSQMRA